VLPPSDVAPSDSARNTPNFANPGHFGVDTVRVAGPVDEHSFALRVQRSKQVVDRMGVVSSPTPTTSSTVLDGGLDLTVQKGWDGRTLAVMEFSVPRRRRGDNTEPATAAEALETIGDVYAEAAEHVGWTCDPHELTLRRLDIARDFEPVLYPGELLERLSRVPPTRRAKTITWLTPDCTGVQTLYRKTDRWVARLYERGNQYAERAASRPPDRAHWERLALKEASKIRYEVEMRTQVLSQAGLSTVGDLSTDALWRQAAKYFSRARFDSVVGDGAAPLVTAATAALSTAGDKSKFLGAVLGQAWLEHHGVRPTVSAKTADKYRKLASDWGVTGRDLQEGDFPRVRLDLDAGRLIHAEGLLSEDLSSPF
jgi:hypothetical protein